MCTYGYEYPGDDDHGDEDQIEYLLLNSAYSKSQELSHGESIA